MQIGVDWRNEVRHEAARTSCSSQVIKRLARLTVIFSRVLYRLMHFTACMVCGQPRSVCTPFYDIANGLKSVSRS